MLCKVWGAKGIILDGEYNYEANANSGGSSSYDLPTTPVTVNVTTGGNMDFIINWGYRTNYSSSSSQYYFIAKLSVKVDGVEYGYTTDASKTSFPYSGQDYSNVTQVISVNLEYGQHTIEVAAVANHFNSNGVSTSVILRTVKIINSGTISTKTGNRNLKPKEVKALGNLAIGTSFGRLSNNDIYVGANPTTSFTTGNITPGNFVGLIDFGGYKIPYYL